LGGADRVKRVHAVRFLALGDSYTIGEGVAEADRWPVQLAARLRERGIAIAEPEIVARTGWTTTELASGIREASPQGPFSLVTLQIGVNDQYRRLGIEDYRRELTALLDRAVDFAGGHPNRVLVLSIPDWGVTPFAAGRDPAEIASQIDRFNAVSLEQAVRARARYLDVTPASRRAAIDPALLAADGLHPSAAMYAEWVDLALGPAIEALGGP
jgi:lysophospholipase L1-like esterase